MAYFPVHDYGTSNMARWMMPAMHQKKNLESAIKSQAAGRRWGLMKEDAASGGFETEQPQQGFSMAASNQPMTQEAQMAESMVPGSSAMLQRMSDRAKKKAQVKQEQDNLKLQISKATLANKTTKGLIDLANKQLKAPGDIGVKHAERLFNEVNKINKSLFGSNYPEYSVGSDPTIITKKIMAFTADEIGKAIDIYEKDPKNSELFGDIWKTLDQYELQFGNNGKALVNSGRTRMKDIKAGHTKKLETNETDRKKKEAAALSEKNKREGQRIGIEARKKAAEKVTTRQGATGMDKSLAMAEEKILNNMESPASKGQATLFNKHSDQPYMYFWQPKKVVPGWGNDIKAGMKKIELPLGKDGRQLTAKDVSHTAKKHGEKIEDVLRNIGVIE